MNWNLAFWVYAFFTLAAVVLVTGSGVRQAQRGNVHRHRRFMLSAGWVVVAFLLAYPVKLIVLGREDKSDWGSAYLICLYVHEAFVLAMLISGAVAAGIGRRIFPKFVNRAVGEEEATSRRRHARFGRISVVAAVLALLWGAVVLLGMLGR